MEMWEMWKANDEDELTLRDMEVLNILQSGPMIGEAIRDELSRFVAKDPRRDDDKIDPDSLDMSEDAFRVRISELIKRGYVTSKDYGQTKGPRSLYALADRGVDFLTKKLNIPGTYIRTAFPPKDQVVHELQVVGVVKKLKKEAIYHGFRLHMRDENYLKSHNKKCQKDDYYPDVYAQLVFDADDSWILKDLAIEIDNDTVGARKIFNKAMFLYEKKTWASVIIVPSLRRLEALQIAFGELIDQEIKKAHYISEQKKEAVLVCACFVIRYDFELRGFDATFLWYNNTKVRAVLPEDYIPIRHRT